MTRRLPLIPLVAVLALAAWTQPARPNCGAESCPLVPQGTGSGRYSLDVGYQLVEQDRLWNGSHEITEAEAHAVEGGVGQVVEQLTRTRLLQVNARARVADRLQVTASWPWVDRIHRHAVEHRAGDSIPSEWHIQGPGDVTVMAHWRVLSGPGPSRPALALGLGVKLPTGERHVEEIDGEEPEPPVRPGSGSTDVLTAVLASRPVPVRALDGHVAAAPLEVSLLARVNGKGTEGYRSGRQYQLGLSAGYPVTRGLLLLTQLNAASIGRDDVGGTDANPFHSGGSSAYVSPGLRTTLLPGLEASALYQIRVYQHSNGPTLVAPYHLALTLGYALGR